MDEMQIIEVNESNIDEHGLFCIKDRKHPGFHAKKNWLLDRFEEGLKLKILASESAGQVGFIEYTPAEYAWRPVNAPGYFLIHCLFVFGRKNLGHGYATQLLKACIEDALLQDKDGVAAITSSGSWLAGKEVYQKGGFAEVEHAGRFELMVYPLKDGPLPTLPNWAQEQKSYQGLNLVISHQCPMHIKAIHDLGELAAENALEMKVTEITTAEEAQRAPSGYGTFSMINDGKLLADHYISKGRFKNIIKKELKKRE